MMSRKFTTREKTLLVVLVVILLCFVYYLFVWQPTIDGIYEAQERKANALEAQEVEMVTAARMRSMEAELEEIYAQDTAVAPIAAYDNTENIVQLLNNVLAGTESYTVNFKDIQFPEEGSLIRRPVEMSVVCADYAQARDIMESIDGCGWRCQLGNMSLSSVSDTGEPLDIASGQVSMTLSVIFFEQ